MPYGFWPLCCPGFESRMKPLGFSPFPTPLSWLSEDDAEPLVVVPASTETVFALPAEIAAGELVEAPEFAAALGRGPPWEAA